MNLKTSLFSSSILLIIILLVPCTTSTRPRFLAFHTHHHHHHRHSSIVTQTFLRHDHLLSTGPNSESLAAGSGSNPGGNSHILAAVSGPNPGGNMEILGGGPGSNPGGNSHILAAGSGPNAGGNMEILGAGSGPNPGGNSRILAAVSEPNPGGNAHVLAAGSGPNPGGNMEILAAGSGPNPGGNSRVLAAGSGANPGGNMESLAQQSGSNSEEHAKTDYNPSLTHQKLHPQTRILSSKSIDVSSELQYELPRGPSFNKQIIFSKLPKGPLRSSSPSPSGHAASLGSALHAGILTGEFSVSNQSISNSHTDAMDDMIACSEDKAEFLRKHEVRQLGHGAAGVVFNHNSSPMQFRVAIAA